MTQTKKLCTHPQGRDKCYHADGEMCCKSDRKDVCIYKYFKDSKEEEASESREENKRS